eukprot:6665827-Prorocentrum_lima.AAC.1
MAGWIRVRVADLHRLSSDLLLDGTSWFRLRQTWRHVQDLHGNVSIAKTIADNDERVQTEQGQHQKDELVVSHAGIF